MGAMGRVRWVGQILENVFAVCAFSLACGREGNLVLRFLDYFCNMVVFDLNFM